MKPQDFVNTYKPYAFKVEEETGIPAVAILAQAALESGWGAKAIGNNLFGIKWKESDGEKRMVLTVEYSENENAFESYSNKTWDSKSKKWRFTLLQHFADYPTPFEGFLAHAKLLLTKMYLPAMQFKHDPKEYLKKVWKCGYATDPSYGKKMEAMVDSISRRL